jgi:uncharacterized protein YuzE
MGEHVMSFSHDPEADAVYITLSQKPYAFGEDLDPDRRIDYASDRTPIGIELLSVSHGVDLTSLPFPDEIGRVLGEAGVRVLAA